MVFHVELDFRFRARADMYKRLVDHLEDIFSNVELQHGEKRGSTYHLIMKDETLSPDSATLVARHLQHPLEKILGYYPSVTITWKGYDQELLYKLRVSKRGKKLRTTIIKDLDDKNPNDKALKPYARATGT